MSTTSSIDPAFYAFDVFEETYKTVASHDIKAAVLIPKNLKPGRHPVIVNIHGGFFATGHSLFAAWFHPWLIKMALDQDAIIISADYRLLPSPGGIADQLEDLEDFWQWIKAKFPTVLQDRAPGHALDFEHLLLVGGSAGGYYVSQVALSHPDEISALAMAYPCVDLKDSIVNEGPPLGKPTVLRFPEADIPSKEEGLAWIRKKRGTVASKGELEITPYCVSLAQNGIFNAEVFEYDGVRLTTNELPLERLKGGARLPKNVWIFHGDDDSVVYLHQSEKFVDLVRAKLPEINLRFDVAEGKDHAFDMDVSVWDAYPASKDAVAFLTMAWLE
ncbi:hypothetical protein PRZ48_010147 [Zasmidium cellare]|uniref:Alpha/beta hydrolase fold-3 domain-containing protein n=1 Tax=Zasmidium cellare TaxID=395010 RepID=A0ABR0EDQ2_ZASCE|nr:hypothetical protein PRZ48_010147 [Zasmidium cellare]